MNSLNARPSPIELDINHTALVVVDMQNSFVSKDGMFDLAGFDISAAGGVIAVNQQLINACRKAGLKVIYLQMTYRADLSDAGSSESPNYHKELGLNLMRTRPELAGKLLIENTWDWRIVDELTPQAEDKVFRKSRYSGFCNTGLGDYLRGEKIRNLLFTGVATNICVESTARDAYFEEFWPIIIEDAINHSGPDFNRQAMLWNFEHVFGWVTRSGDVMAMLESAPASQR